MNLNRIPAAVPPQPDNPTNEERQFLGQFALASRGRPEDFDFVTNLLSPPPDITTIAQPGAFRGIKVGVIGGGLAGLSAAYELRKLGFDITLFEALEDHIGGRVYTYYFDRDQNLYAELGAMRIPVTHETTWHYINLFKLPTRPFIQVNSNSIIHLRDVSVRNDPEGLNVMNYIYPRYQLEEWERRTKWQDLVYLGFERHLKDADPLARSEILQVKPDYQAPVLYWDSMSNRKMLESSRLSQDAINLISSLTPLPGQNLYSSYLDYIQESYTGDLSFLYEVPGGLARLPEAFFTSLSAKAQNGNGNVTIRLGTWITGIYLNGDTGRVNLEFFSARNRRAFNEHFDYIVCTIPFSTLRNINIDPLFSPAKMQAIKEVNYIPAQKTGILFRQRFWEGGGPNEQIIGGASHTDLPITTTWYPSDHLGESSGSVRSIPWTPPSHTLNTNNVNQNAAQPGVLLASYNFNLDATRLANQADILRFEEIKRELGKVHRLPKEYLDRNALDFKTVNWNAQPWFRGALCFFDPGQKQLFAYAMAVPEYNNKVFFAGDHISAKHRWMQGALKSGMDAANAVAAACGELTGHQ